VSPLFLIIRFCLSALMKNSLFIFLDLYLDAIVENVKVFEG